VIFKSERITQKGWKLRMLFCALEAKIFLCFEAVSRLAHNVWLVAGGQLKTCALSNEIKINKELQTSMTQSPARLPQAFVIASLLFSASS
jgi:hypothetical protein